MKNQYQPWAEIDRQLAILNANLDREDKRIARMKSKRVEPTKQIEPIAIAELPFTLIVENRQTVDAE